jgi:hypothetical protein
MFGIVSIMLLESLLMLGMVVANCIDDAPRILIIDNNGIVSIMLLGTGGRPDNYLGYR